MDNSFDSLLNASAVPQDDKRYRHLLRKAKITGIAAMSCQSR